MAFALLYLICFILVAFSLPCMYRHSSNFRKCVFRLITHCKKQSNRDRLVTQGSKVELTSDGQFVLNDARGNQIWYADSFRTGVSHAAMLDTGNFVLANRNSTYLWESFDQPTDTILPTQTLNQNGILFARYTETNYSIGRFMFSLQSDGSLSLSTTTFPQHSRRTDYWSTGNTDIGFQVIFNQSGLIYLTSKNGAIRKTISPTPVSIEDFYQRATLDYNGVLRHYVYPKSSVGRWPNAWSTSSFIPSNICTAIVEKIGGGACGVNSLCRLDDLGPTCHCPNGYTFIDPNDVLKGCKQNFVPQSCGAGSSPETDAFDFQEMKNTNMHYLDYELFEGLHEDWCRQSCLEDCFCAVVYFNGDGVCYKKGLPFSNGVIDPSVTGKAIVKIRKDNSTLKDGSANSKNKDDSTLISVGSVLLSSLGILNFILPLITYVVVSRIYFSKAEVVQPYQVMTEVNLR
ncbi:hypothetical protein M0R45_017862 [Rubus argutus]|uniref:Bulb-type lectin domain-containing protein n=1 Tax=Rubus argutus TaxID=59490 RepID=A0AAW1XWQ9_RUBAR